MQHAFSKLLFNTFLFLLYTCFLEGKHCLYIYDIYIALPCVVTLIYKKKNLQLFKVVDVEGQRNFKLKCNNLNLDIYFNYFKTHCAYCQKFCRLNPVVWSLLSLNLAHCNTSLLINIVLIFLHTKFDCYVVLQSTASMYRACNNVYK